MDLLKELFRFRRYKNNQGRLIRRLTMVGIWCLFAVAAYKTSPQGGGLPLLQEQTTLLWSLAGITGVFGLWFGYRTVNWHRFADFMIAVEAEMVKVSWPGNAELHSSTTVVLSVFLFLACLILIFDSFWGTLFKLIGVI